MVSIVSGNGLLIDGTKPLAVPISFAIKGSMSNLRAISYELYKRSFQTINLKIALLKKLFL